MKSFAIIGLGRFGSAMAKSIEKEGGEIIAIDMDSEKVRKFENDFTSVVEADSTDIDTLRDLGIADIDGAVVSVGEKMGESILITLLLKELKVPLIMVKALDKLHGKVLKKIGANNIVYPEKDVAEIVSKRLLWPGYNEIPLAPGLFMVEINAPGNFVDKALKDLKIREKYKANVVAIKRKKPTLNENGQTDYTEEMFAPPKASMAIKKGDSIIVVCNKKMIEIFREIN